MADIFRGEAGSFLQDYGRSLSSRSRSGCFPLFRPAAPRSWAGTSGPATTAGTARSRTTRAATVIVPSARPWPAPRGSNKRAAELLPISYFHVVFTLPAEIARLGAAEQAAALRDVVRGGQPDADGSRRESPALGGRRDRPAGRAAHLGPEPDAPSASALRGQRRRAVAGGDPLDRLAKPHYFLPVRVLSRVFRNKYRALLQKAFRRGRAEVLRRTRNRWPTPAPFGVFSTRRPGGSGWSMPSGRFAMRLAS